MEDAQEVVGARVREGLLVGCPGVERPAVDDAAGRGVRVAVLVAERHRATDGDRGRLRLEDAVPDGHRGRTVDRARGRLCLGFADDDPTVVPGVVVVPLVDVRVCPGRRQPDLGRPAGLEVAGVEATPGARPESMPLVVAVDEPDDPAGRDADLPVAQTVAERDGGVGRPGDGVMGTHRRGEHGEHEQEQGERTSMHTSSRHADPKRFQAT